MNRVLWKFVLVGAVVAIALSAESRQASAQWSGWYQPATWSCCTTPFYPAAYTVGYVPYRRASYIVGYAPYATTWGAYLGWRPGPIRRLFFGPYRWYGGPIGWSCATTALAYDPCCTSDVGSGTSAPAPTPASRPAPSPTPTLAPPPQYDPSSAPAITEPKTSAKSPETSGTLTVVVPNDAKVTVNGRETQSLGSHRQFVSYGLKPGFSYKYVVHAEVVRNGIVQEDNRTVILTAGQSTALAFGFNTNAADGLAMAQ
jgi:uncharacterized protein (TIGR03000 family)